MHCAVKIGEREGYIRRVLNVYYRRGERYSKNFAQILFFFFFPPRNSVRRNILRDVRFDCQLPWKFSAGRNKFPRANLNGRFLNFLFPLDSLYLCILKAGRHLRGARLRKLKCFANKVSRVIDCILTVSGV